MKTHTPEVAAIIAAIRREGAEFREGTDSLKQIGSSYNWERGEIVRQVAAAFPDRVEHTVECRGCRSGQPHSGCSDCYTVEGIGYEVRSGMLA